MWWAFHDPDVRAVLHAYDFFVEGQAAEWWGPDPPWWLVEGVRVYHRALEAVRADARELARQRKDPAKRARLPPGAVVEHEVTG